MINYIDQMGIIGEKLDIDFVISTGDNFYDNGLTGVHDPAFHHSFTDIYTAPSLQKQWYSGNVHQSPYLYHNRFLNIFNIKIKNKLQKYRS